MPISTGNKPRQSDDPYQGPDEPPRTFHHAHAVFELRTAGGTVRSLSPGVERSLGSRDAGTNELTCSRSVFSTPSTLTLFHGKEFGKDSDWLSNDCRLFLQMNITQIVANLD
jgi:hypothetical protein